MALTYKHTLTPDAIRAALRPAVEVGAIAAAGQLDYNLAASSSTRTGEHYEGQPRPSSINIPAAEFLQEQSGQLRRSVGYEMLADEAAALVGVGLNGSSGQSQEELEDNEYGNGPRAGRFSVTRTMQAAGTHARMMREIRAVLA